MNYKYIFKSFALAAVVFFASCNKVIDLNPTHSLDATNAFKTLNDYETALNGTYSQLRNTSYYGNADGAFINFSTLPDMMSDNLTESVESLGNFRQITDWVYASDNGGAENVWQQCYYTINMANIVVNGIDAFAATDQRMANRIKGQALALRALAHFDLLRYFAPNFDRNSTELGVALRLTNDLTGLPRRTVKDCYDQIYKDLNDALTMLRNTDRAVNTASNRNRFDEIGVNALLARVALYAKQYNEAVTYATAVINARPLATRTQFPDVWKDASVADVVWSAAFNLGEGSPGSNAYSANSNRSSFDASADLIALYDQANDIRFSSYFTVAVPGPNRAGRFIVTKYVGRGAARDGIVNFKSLRVGEMYLIRAEANALAGNAAAGLADYNALRAARIQNYVPQALAGQALIDAIAAERRRELAVEGHRWFDLKRTTRTINRTNCRPPATQCALPPTSHRWALPIPNGEIVANPAMTGQQNTGY